MDVASRGTSAIVEYDYAAQEPDELDLIKGAVIHSIKQMPGGWWEGTLQSNGKTGMFPDNFVRVIDNGGDENKVTLREKTATANRRCKVIFSYTQVNDDELSLAVGDVIEFLGEVEEGWWRGRLKNKIGVFPSNFVTVIEPSPILASKRPSAGPNTSTITTTAAAATTAKSATAASLLEKSSSSSIGATSSTSINTIVNQQQQQQQHVTTSSSTGNSSTTKKMNRLSMHNSKEDLLNSSSSNISNSSRAAAADDDVAPSLPPKPQREYCRVEYPYAPQNDDELELKVGEIITIISMDLPDKGWWKGELHGKVGVFPDNFVKLMDVTSLGDSHHPQRTAKSSNTTASGAPTNSTNNTNHANTTASSHSIRSATGVAVTSAAQTAAAAATGIGSGSGAGSTSSTTTNVFIKKSGSNSSTHSSSNRKDSFGSYDSLNDILSETGLQSGNVAAQRKSLENKNLDVTANAADASSRLALKKQQLQQQQQQTNNGNITVATTTTTANMSSSQLSSAAAAVANELRKSLESLDEKTKTPPPPVLTKKPTVTTKKPSSVTSVASNLFGFGKQKTKSSDSKLSTAASQDSADGVGSSKMSAGSQNEAVVLRRAATIAAEDADFDRLERGSILTDMRAGRVKAPKRRPPSAAINVIGESNNNNTIYLNGGGGGSTSGGELSSQEEGNQKQSSDENSFGEEQLAKPRTREWEKKKAPWMEELKASQVKKKTSPSIEPRTQSGIGGAATVADRTSRLFAGEDLKTISNNHTSSISSSSSSATTHSTTKVQQHTSSSITSSSLMQQSMIVESSGQQLLKKELNSNAIADIMTKSMSNKFSNDSSHTTTTTTAAAAAAASDDVRIRPNSLSIRNRSISPALTESGVGGGGSGSGSVGGGARTTGMRSNASPANSVNTSVIHEQTNSNGVVSSAHSSVNNLYQQRLSGNSNAAAPTATAAESSARIGDLERRVGKLELTVVSQQRTIDELMRLLREETDRVKVLRGELDKYAQCVTQV